MDDTTILVGFIAFAIGIVVYALLAPRRDAPVVYVQTEPYEQRGGAGCLLLALAIVTVLVFLNAIS
jgi:hypothetical protein